MTEVRVDPQTGPVAGRRRDDGRDVPEIVDRELAERLVAQARQAGVDLVGQDGLLRQMTKAVLERSLAAELSDHLGYESGDLAGAGGPVALSVTAQASGQEEELVTRPVRAQ